MRRGPPLEIVLPLVLAIGALGVAQLVLISRIVRFERERHADAWEADGRPRAPWEKPWRLPPPGDPSMPRGPADLLWTNWVLMRWLVATPAWMREDAQARRMLWTVRVLQVAGLAAVAGWFVLLLRTAD